MNKVVGILSVKVRENSGAENSCPVSGCSRVKRCSFTLIELLVVIAIIAILAGQMCPVSEESLRLSSAETFCSSRWALEAVWIVKWRKA